MRAVVPNVVLRWDRLLKINVIKSSMAYSEKGFQCEIVKASDNGKNIIMAYYLHNQKYGDCVFTSL